MTAREQAVRIVQDTLCHGVPFQLRDSDSFLENGIIDSLGVLELARAIKQRFQVDVEDEDLSPENLDSIECLAAYLRRKGVAE